MEVKSGLACIRVLNVMEHTSEWPGISVRNITLLPGHREETR
jgi:hypothetical protein